MEIKLSKTFQAPAEKLYHAFLIGEEHSRMTGGTAVIVPQVGRSFTAWDGYISGKILELIPFQKIVQSWRTTEFPADQPDSMVEITFTPIPEGTLVTILHSELTDADKHYKKGWQDYYFKPMARYFK